MIKGILLFIEIIIVMSVFMICLLRLFDAADAASEDDKESDADENNKDAKREVEIVKIGGTGTGASKKIEINIEELPRARDPWIQMEDGKAIKQYAICPFCLCQIEFPDNSEVCKCEKCGNLIRMDNMTK